MSSRKTVMMALGAVLAATALVAAGCGAASSSSTASQTPAAAVSSPGAAATTGASPQATGQPAAALTGEAASVAAGDVPDNQVFLTLKDKAGGFSLKYPEGWAQKGGGNDLTIHDKDNIVHVSISQGPTPSVASVNREMQTLKQSTPSLKAGAPAKMTMSGRPAIMVKYTTESAPNPVTGKRVTLMVDRYYFSNGGRVAVLDLGTPQGVDNVDAYRMMSESFTWLP